MACPWMDHKHRGSVKPTVWSENTFTPIHSTFYQFSLPQRHETWSHDRAHKSVLPWETQVHGTDLKTQNFTQILSKSSSFKEFSSFSIPWPKGLCFLIVKCRHLSALSRAKLSWHFWLTHSNILTELIQISISSVNWCRIKYLSAQPAKAIRQLVFELANL
jgi:hypothetical protein